MKIIEVVIGILKRPQNEVLIALRPPHVTSPGIWEFPGGKVEPGETLSQALRREYAEEIGIEVTAENALMTIEYKKPDKHLLLHTFDIVSYEGEPKGCESQEIRWVSIGSLTQYEFPPATAEIIRLLLATIFES